LKNCFISKNNITNITIGGFDGMHLAHQELFKHLDKDGAIVVIDTSYANLTPKKYRENFTSYPIFYYTLDDIKHLSGVQFVELLKKDFPQLAKIIVGYDFHFGKQRLYNAQNLKKIFKGEVQIIDEYLINNISVHSRFIRELLTQGKIVQANDFLGRAYQIKGNIIKGQGLGQKQFVPTLNIQVDNFLIPQNGIYATQTIIDNTKYKSITFIGHRVSTDNNFAIETHILDQDIHTTSSTLEILFYEKIRENQKFNNPKQLQNQILKDIGVVKNIRLN
jgi:riboflavin kinase/FMN adenylyltransferase